MMLLSTNLEIISLGGDSLNNFILNELLQKGLVYLD